MTRLEKDQVEYDLGCERIMQDNARVEGSRLDVGECSYTTVVIPPEMTNLESSTFSLLKEFARGGGRIVALSSPYMLDGRGVTEMDAFTGESFGYPFESKGDKVKFDVSLPPAGSLLLYVHDGKAPAYPQRDTRECPDEIAPEGEMSVTADSLNALYVDFCDLEVNGKKYESIHFADAAFKYYNEAGYNGNPWAEAIQFRSASARE